jgi:hypothetical protein
VIPGLPGGPANFVPPNGEVFYWVAQANLNTAGHGGVGTTPSLLMMGVEGAWVPAPGPDVFNRLRFRVGVPNPGTYTVTYPYGAKTFNVAALGPRRRRRPTSHWRRDPARRAAAPISAPAARSSPT